MKVIVCGAGQVGTSIAAYLSEEGNSVTLIDLNEDLVTEINEKLDVSAIVGHAAHPHVLEQAGAADAEMIVAATQADEVNMMACQVGHSLFNIPVKVARIRERSYLDPVWNELFSRDNLPIDYIISPEDEVAQGIANRIRVPGAYNIIPLVDGRVKLASVIAPDDCPLINTPLKHLTPLFPELAITIVAVVRGDKKIIPYGEDMILAGDEVYFVAAADHMARAMTTFGFDEPEARHILIIGGGKVGTRLAEIMDAHMKNVSVRMVEGNLSRAERISEILSATVVHGDALDRQILEEADIEKAEAVIAVTNHDETNILVSMLAKQYGVERAITLVNNNALVPMAPKFGVDAVVNPRAITISGILRHVRRGRIKAAHSLSDGFAEVLDLEALDTSPVVNTPIRELKKPDNMIFGLIVRENDIILPRPDTVIKPDDRVIVLAAHDVVKKVEQMFAVRPEYF